MDSSKPFSRGCSSLLVPQTVHHLPLSKPVLLLPYLWEDVLVFIEASRHCSRHSSQELPHLQSTFKCGVLIYHVSLLPTRSSTIPEAKTPIPVIPLLLFFLENHSASVHIIRDSFTHPHCLCKMQIWSSYPFTQTISSPSPLSCKTVGKAVLIGYACLS